MSLDELWGAVAIGVADAVGASADAVGASADAVAVGAVLAPVASGAFVAADGPFVHAMANRAIKQRILGMRSEPRDVIMDVRCGEGERQLPQGQQ
jgi:hypothetical protein